MKAGVFLCLVFCATGILASDARLEFALSVSPAEWKVEKGNVASPILILWKVKNAGSQRLVLPIGRSTTLEIVDDKGRTVPGGEASDGLCRFPTGITVRSKRDGLAI